MSIINRAAEMVKREYELQEPIAVAVEKYATFIQSTPDHVVNSALKIVIWRDVEFRRWREHDPSNSPCCSLLRLPSLGGYGNGVLP